MEAHRDEGRFGGVGGVGIFWQAWLPESETRALVLIAHGGAEHSGRYAWVAQELVSRGYAVYALDHRGHGRSEGQRAFIDRLDHAVADLDTLRDLAADLAAERHPPAPCFLLGHSLGGLIALQYALRHQEKLDGLILSAPLASLDVNALTRAAGRTLSRLAPRLPVYKIDATTVSRDRTVVSAYEEDPLNHRGRLPARTIGEIGEAVASLPDRLPTLRLPILTLHGSGDRLVDPAGSVLVRDRSGSPDCTLTSYEGLYHEILNEPERERVVGDISDWIDGRLPARAASSGSDVRQPQ